MYTLSAYQEQTLVGLANGNCPTIAHFSPRIGASNEERHENRTHKAALQELISEGLLHDVTPAFSDSIETNREYTVFCLTEMGLSMFSGAEARIVQ